MVENIKSLQFDIEDNNVEITNLWTRFFADGWTSAHLHF